MNNEFLQAARNGDLLRVQRMLADGEARITDVDRLGRTALLHAAMGGSDALPTLIWLLEEGGACITEKDHRGQTVLLMAATYSRILTCQWLLEHGGANIADRTDAGTDVWHIFQLDKFISDDAAEVTALLRVMVLKGAPPAEFEAQLRPEHARVVEEGTRLRAALPAYLTQRRALLDAHCPLIAPLRDLVHSYDPAPTTTEELWATGLGAAPQRAQHPRVEAAIMLSLRRDRLRQSKPRIRVTQPTQ
jgi:hypothetical protein